MPYLGGEAGWKARDTSASAARAARPTAKTIRALVIDTLKQAPGPMTADEVADAIGIPFISVRPRLSELAKDGRIEDSGIRRESQFGRRACAWRITRKDAA